MIPQQDDFFFAGRLPKKPYCTDDLTYGIRPRSYATAIKRLYIQVNPPHLRIFSLYDLDYPGAYLAWEEANLLPPAWGAINTQNMHGHLAYALSAPVLTADFGGRQAALRYLAAIEAAFRAYLKADEGFSGLITKNPVHPQWRLLKGPPQAITGWTLDELAGCIDANDLRKFKPYAARTNFDAVGLGRNCTVFNVVSRWSYRHIREFKAESCEKDWRSSVYRQCLQVNGDFPTPMWEKEVACIAKSIANWVWNRFDIAASDRRFAQLQAHRNTLRKTHGAGSGRTRFIKSYELENFDD